MILAHPGETTTTCACGEDIARHPFWGWFHIESRTRTSDTCDKPRPADPRFDVDDPPGDDGPGTIVRFV